MNVVTKEYTVFEYKELSDKAKERAYTNWLQERYYPFRSDNEKTLRMFERIFPIAIKDWGYDSQNGNIDFEFDETEIIENLSGFRLSKYIWNNYKEHIFKGKYYGRLSPFDKNGNKIEISKEHPIGQRHIKRYSKVLFDTCGVLTGYCLDDDILEPIYNFLNKPNNGINFYDLMQQCLNSWVGSCVMDCEANESEETFINEIENNDNMFLENGDLFNESKGVM